jgi:hypothetical protein
MLYTYYFKDSNSFIRGKDTSCSDDFIYIYNTLSNRMNITQKKLGKGMSFSFQNRSGGTIELEWGHVPLDCIGFVRSFCNDTMIETHDISNITSISYNDIIYL